MFSVDHPVVTIVAPRRSGKSHLMKMILRTSFEDIYDHIILMCPSLSLNEDYDEFIDNSKYTFIDTVDAGIIDELFEKQSDCRKQVLKAQRAKKDKKKKKKDILFENHEIEMPLHRDKEAEYVCPRTLVILDDVVDSGVLRFGGAVDKIAERGRHMNISAFISAQRLSAVSRSVRLNSDYFIIFSPFSISEIEQFLENFVSKSMVKEMRSSLARLFEKKYEFLILDNSETQWSKKFKSSNADDFVQGIVYPMDISHVFTTPVEKIAGIKRKQDTI